MRPPLGRSHRAPVAACVLRGLAVEGQRGGLSPRSLRRTLIARRLPWSRVRGVWYPDSGLAADPGREAADELDAPFAAQRGPA